MGYTQLDSTQLWYMMKSQIPRLLWNSIDGYRHESFIDSSHITWLFHASIILFSYICIKQWWTVDFSVDAIKWQRV